VAFRDETSPEIESVADEVEWLRVGQLAKLIKAFSSRDIRHCVMAGQIAPKNLFEFRPDLKTAAMLFRLKERNAHTIFGAIGDELAKGGVELIEAIPWLGQVMPGPDFHLGPKLTKQQREDVSLGYRLAKKVSQLEIGQTVVVKEGTVLAAEGFEGTDACLRRGGELAGAKGGGVAVKVALHWAPNLGILRRVQDRRPGGRILQDHSTGSRGSGIPEPSEWNFRDHGRPVTKNRC